PIAETEAGLVPFITDFGLARRLEEDTRLTPSRGAVGTPSHMAPEQLTNPRNVTVAVDVWALGVILYELLTGELPFAGSHEYDVLQKVIGQEPRPPRSPRPGVDRDLEIICLKCLSKDPQQRYTTAVALAEDLDRRQRGEPIVARPTNAAERVLKWVRRRPAVTALLATVV